MAMPNGREMTRAERFEDEKKRIIESCFSKKDDDGSCEQRPSFLPARLASLFLGFSSLVYMFFS